MAEEIDLEYASFSTHFLVIIKSAERERERERGGGGGGEDRYEGHKSEQCLIRQRQDPIRPISCTTIGQVIDCYLTLELNCVLMVIHSTIAWGKSEKIS